MSDIENRRPFCDDEETLAFRIQKCLIEFNGWAAHKEMLKYQEHCGPQEVIEALKRDTQSEINNWVNGLCLLAIDYLEKHDCGMNQLIQGSKKTW